MPTNLEPVSKQLTIIVGLTVVGFMAFGLALSFYRNILFEKTLSDIRNQNKLLSEEIAYRYTQLEYYKSAQYKDKYAKQNLGKINPGESVLIITHEPEDVYYQTIEDLSPAEQQEATYLELLRQMPVMEHWKLYLFYPKKIEELRQSL